MSTYTHVWRDFLAMFDCRTCYVIRSSNQGPCCHALRIWRFASNSKVKHGQTYKKTRKLLAPNCSETHISPKTGYPKHLKVFPSGTSISEHTPFPTKPHAPVYNLYIIFASKTVAHTSFPTVSQSFPQRRCRYQFIQFIIHRYPMISIDIHRYP
jgi:hypothetical protein